MATCVSSSGPLLCDLRRTSLWWPQQKGYRRIQQRDRFAYVPSLQVRAARKRQTSKVHGRRVLCQNHQVCAAWPSCRRQPILRCSITCPRPARQGLDGPSRPSQFLMQSDGNGKRVFAADRRRHDPCATSCVFSATFYAAPKVYFVHARLVGKTSQAAFRR